MQEDDVIGLLSGSNIADLKPLGDRILISVRVSDPRGLPAPLLTLHSI